MKFSKREDVEAPVDVVFRALTDFNGFTRAAMKRGAEITRTDTLSQPGPGMAWAVKAVVRGRTRNVRILLERIEPGQAVECSIESNGMQARMEIEFVELSRSRTRIVVSLDVKAATMTARLLLQSARLAKGTLDRRFARRISDFCRDIEAKERRAQKPA